MEPDTAAPVPGSVAPGATSLASTSPVAWDVMVRWVPDAIGAVHVAVAVGWLAVLVLALDPGGLARLVPARLRRSADAVRGRTTLLAALVALSGLGLTAIELTEGASTRTDRAVLDDPSLLWVALVAAKVALLAGVAAVGVVGGSGGTLAAVGPSSDAAAVVLAGTDRAIRATAVLVALALVLGLVADAVGVGG